MILSDLDPRTSSRTRVSGLLTSSDVSRRSLFRGAGLGLTALALSACSSRETVARTDDASSAGVTVTDMRGVETRLSVPVERIATAVIPAPAMIAAVDGGYDKIVGVNESTRTAVRQGIFQDMFPESTETTIIAPSSFVPNVETIVELQPDVVFQWSDRGDDLVAPIESAGFTVLGLVYGTQENLEEWISIFGEVLGKPERSAEILDWMHAEESRLRSIVHAKDRSVRALHLKQSGDGYAARNSATYEHFWITLAGGENVAADLVGTDSVVGAEQLIEWDPEVITLGGFDQRTPQDLYGDPALAPISAIRNRRVYKAPVGAYRWEVPCAESPLMWQWATKILHPDLEIGDLRAQTAKRIGYLYNYQVSEAQVDRILRTDLNRTSANYKVFSA